MMHATYRLQNDRTSQAQSNRFFESYIPQLVAVTLIVGTVCIIAF